jgi:hypothetical protein
MFSSVTVKVQVSAPYVTRGLITECVTTITHMSVQSHAFTVVVW